MKQRTCAIHAFEEAKKLIPGGVNSPVRAFGGVDVPPVFIASAQGAYITDIDGNTYIDYVGSWGPMILGHAHRQVVEAVADAAHRGTSFGAPTPAETELAGKIVAAVASIEQVRLVSSGTEAAMTAVRLARGFTGRDMIIKMSGCYHGHTDAMLVSAGSGLAEHGVPASAGVPGAVAAQTVIVPYNDLDAVRLAFEHNAGRVAAVIIEPVAANIGVVLPVEGYLQGLRDLADANDALLIFDEVITGFRLALGGAQQRYGVRPDITCLGKIIGGGLPLAAIGASRQIMAKLAPLGPVYQAGTLSGNPLATAAANVTLDLLSRPGVYEQLEQTSAALEQGLRETAKKASVPVTINRVGSLLSCFFTDQPVRNFADVQKTDILRFKRFFAEMLNRGIYLAPSAYEAAFVSLAHTEKEIEKTIDASYHGFLQAKE
jgi:glutamate-1-semialdehyde 2,1-aminomutase